ncbi:MAG: hypothetical protein V1743_06520 [Nanoarchaeota archaeon]
MCVKNKLYTAVRNASYAALIVGSALLGCGKEEPWTAHKGSYRGFAVEVDTRQDDRRIFIYNYADSSGIFSESLAGKHFETGTLLNTDGKKTIRTSGLEHPDSLENICTAVLRN